MSFGATDRIRTRACDLLNEAQTVLICFGLGPSEFSQSLLCTGVIADHPLMQIQHLSQSLARCGHQIVRARLFKVSKKLLLSANATLLLCKIAFAYFD